MTPVATGVTTTATVLPIKSVLGANVPSMKIAAVSSQQCGRVGAFEMQEKLLGSNARKFNVVAIHEVQHGFCVSVVLV